LSAPLERIQQGDRAARTDQHQRWVNLDHRQPTTCRGDRVAGSRVRLLSHPQRVELGLKRGPIDRDRARVRVGHLGFRRTELVRFMVHGYLNSLVVDRWSLSWPASLAKRAPDRWEAQTVECDLEDRFGGIRGPRRTGYPYG
jgi:hypothetical protein